MLRKLCLCIALLAASAHAHAFLWSLLGRGVVVRGAGASAARTAAGEVASGTRAVGVASRAGGAGRDFTWLEREVAKSAIRRAITHQSSTRETSEQPLPEDTCLTIEFDGHYNFVANYCRSSLVISEFAQFDPSTNEVTLVSCRPECVIHPAQYMRFQPLQTVGPFVSAKSRQLDSDSVYTPPAGNTPSTTSPQVLPTGVACGQAALRMTCPSIAIPGTDCRRCQ